MRICCNVLFGRNGPYSVHQRDEVAENIDICIMDNRALRF